MWAMLYLCNLIFAVVATFSFKGWLSDAAGHSLALTKSIGQFDFTFIMDLLRNYPGYSILTSHVCMMIITYVIFSALLAGGILHVFIHYRETFKVREFLAGGAMYFWRMIRLALYFLLFQSAALAILFFILIAIGLNPKEMESDVQFLWYLRIILPIYLFAALVIAIMHDYVKIHVVTQDANPMTQAFGAGVRFVIRHFGSVLLLYGMSLIILLAMFLLYTQIKHLIPGSSGPGILIGFLLSQLFLFGRIGVKLLIISSANALIKEG
jgi:hypothetical protein